ncbi:peptidoglycan D,D-transpeptidase FtsI family protein [Candidatus Thiosymbion oneisti]|uniref:peptidoglycan D,D-transpeptidase FtsI family protein n=1 Tax=Candidatus Thiosymbion oneisti TaxID=589554 RepID=UPI000AA85190|nr:penicillin-binding transpeptidase domain-containing protein [Candidatus Thiosymbion oneisti]
MTPPDPPQLFGAIVGSDAWPILRIGLQGAFFLTLVYLIKLGFDLRGLMELRHLGRSKRSFHIFFIALTILFSCVLLYQATWQLTGLFRPQFLAFMQAYDRRQFNPAHRIRRGRILDRRGEVLAFSERRGDQVLRRYPYGPAFAHVVGYSDAKFGTSGLEAAANAHLNGATVDSLPAWGELGHRLLTRDRNPRGQDLALTLDTELQLLAAQRLDGKRGAVVLLDPRDGAVRVLVSTPAFDPNRISAGLFRTSQPETPLLNRATQGLYPPGSTFKILTAALAVEKGFKGTLPCPADGYATSSRYRKIRDHEYYAARRSGRVWKGHGNLGLATALVKSSNVFFAQLGVGYGHAAFSRNLERFRFNRRIDLYRSPYGAWTMNTGRIPEIATSDQYGLAQASIGQGKILVTPAHMALIVAAVANRGLAMGPRLVATDPPIRLARFMSAAGARRLAGMLRKVVTQGTGRSIDGEGPPIAGKTGTAQNPQGAAHSWFVGFAPANRPALAVAVMVEHGGYGSKTAAPIARDLLVRAHALGTLQ